MPRPRGAGRGCRADRRAGAATDHGGNTRHQRFFNLLRANEMNMRVDTTRSHDHAFTRNDLGCTTNRHRDIRLNIRITCFTNPCDASSLDADIRFNDTPVIQDGGIGDDGIHHIFMCTL